MSDCGRYVIITISEGCDPVNKLYYCDLHELKDGIKGKVWGAILNRTCNRVATNAHPGAIKWLIIEKYCLQTQFLSAVIFCEYDITSLFMTWFASDSANSDSVKTTGDDHIVVQTAMTREIVCKGGIKYKWSVVHDFASYDLFSDIWKWPVPPPRKQVGWFVPLLGSSRSIAVIYQDVLSPCANANTRREMWCNYSIAVIYQDVLSPCANANARREMWCNYS